jgi:HEAT repeat protein
VTLIGLLVLAAIAQGIFLGGVIVLLFANRARSRLRTRRMAAASGQLAPVVRRWLVGESDADAVAAALRALPARRAAEQFISLAATHAAPAQMAELSEHVVADVWVARALRRARSPFWWRRLEAARLLAVLGGPRHRDLLRRLLRDRHPAVQGVAAAGIPRVADLDAVAFVLDGLPQQPLVVRLYQFNVLAEAWWFTTPALLERLVPGAPGASLEVWVSLADAIGSGELLARICELSTHPDPGVRVVVARGLKKYFHPNAIRALRSMLGDPDWRVRAQAARSVGALRDEDAVPQLTTALHDRQWWVRFRAGLALAQLGERGREALRQAREGGDRYATEMATMISGFSAGTVVEIAEA